VGLQREKNRLSLKDSERPLFGYVVVEHRAGCSTVHDEQKESELVFRSVLSCCTEESLLST
jgi:hypothetical protein